MQILLSLLPYLFVAIIAAALGSFYKTLGDRILYYFYGPGRKKSDGHVPRTMPAIERWKLLLVHPSTCPQCEQRIPVLYLLPVAGWFLRRGRCFHCNAAIPVSHPLIETAFAAIGVISLVCSGNAVGTLLILLYCGHLIVAMNTDWHRFSLDYENTAVLLILSMAVVYVHEGLAAFPQRFYTLLGVAVFFLISYLITRGRQPGFGDILLGAVIGFQHGFPWLLLPLQIGAAGSLLHLWLVNRNMRSAAPLGFYMAGGSILTTVLTLFLAWNRG